MKWLGERPRSIVEAWNILCEALNERMEFYGYSGGSYRYSPIPAVPCRRAGRKIRDMIPEIRAMICRMVGISYDWTASGSWVSDPCFSVPEDPEDPLFAGSGVDGLAFFSTPETLPACRHVSSEFIKAAAGVLDFAVRYPVPMLCEKPPNVAGFGVSALLAAESFENGSVLRGTSLDDGVLVLPDDMRPLVNVSWNILARWDKDVGRERAYNHRLVYHGAGREIGNNRVSYRLPYLYGKCGIRVDAHVKCRTVLPGEAEKVIDLDRQEFTIDFSTGLGDDKLDFSRASPEISDAWNCREDDPAVRRSVLLYIDQMEVKIGTDNFAPLKYKFIS
ncbi:MAG: hypothetical protein E7058_01625 [Lentisphaerae bacterium]|nr:hypothetical protein [Lentisphaerota bacterium]